MRNYYRPHTEYDRKVMFSVCLFTGGAPQTRGVPPGVPPNWGAFGAPPGGTPNWGSAPGGTPLTGGGAPRGYPPNLDKNVGQNLGQKMDKVLDKKWTQFWTKNWTNILETFGVGGARAVRLLRSRRRTVLFFSF